MNLVIEFTFVFILFFLYRAIDAFDPNDSSKARPSFIAIFITHLVRSVLSLLDVAFIIGVNYGKRENPIIVLSALTNVGLYTVQLLAVLPQPWIRGHITIINLVFLCIYGLISIVASITDGPAPPGGDHNRVGPKLFIRATKHYCHARFSTYCMFEALYLTRALGPYRGNWLIWMLPILMLYGLGLVALVASFFAGIFLALVKKDGGSGCIIFAVILVLVLLFTPIILFIYYLNGLEARGENKAFLIWMIWISIFFSALSAISSIRIKNFIADDDLRNAVFKLRKEKIQAENAPEPQNGEPPLRRSQSQNVESVVRYLPVIGDHLHRHDSASLPAGN